MELTFDIEKYNAIAARGFCSGMGASEDGQVCVRQAYNLACGRGISDDCDPCTDYGLHRVLMRLNDSLRWPSPEDRATGLGPLLFASLGTAGKLDRKKFAKRYAELTIQRVLPIALRLAGLEKEAVRCEKEGTEASARHAQKKAASAYAAYAGSADAACSFADAASASAAASAYAAGSADAAAYAACSFADAAAASASYAASALIESVACAVKAIEEQGLK